jgi:hypothetical protein
VVFIEAVAAIEGSAAAIDNIVRIEKQLIGGAQADFCSPDARKAPHSRSSAKVYFHNPVTLF